MEPRVELEVALGSAQTSVLGVKRRAKVHYFYIWSIG